MTISTPNKFLQYPNMQPPLAAGEYTIVAATVGTSVADSFSLDIEDDKGRKTQHNGQWISSGGPDHSSPANPRYNFTLNTSGGIKISLSSTANNYLYLLDRNGNILYQDNDSGTGNNALIDLPSSLINNQKWTEAYYATIDPLNERDTLNKWKTRNGFDQGYDVHVIFRDTKDLGYGRSMFMRQNANGCVAIYVENFRVDLIQGLPYSTLNLTAAIEDDRLHHFGSNAIEFSDLDGDCDGSEPMFNKFFTFKADPDNPGADEPRLLSVDLDGRGEKFMPIPCITCHGGTARPLLADGTLQSAALPDQLNPELRLGDTNARLQPLEVDSFEFSDKPGYTRADQEARLKQINSVVFSTFPAVRADGEWDADFIREVVDGWYQGHFLTTSNSSGFDGSYVPQGWKYDPTGVPTRPASSEELFLKVIKPYCFSCHSKRGTTLGSNGSNSNFGGNSKDVNFSTYEKFISHADQIEDYVYARGLMPMSKLTFDKFWQSDAPEILATHLSGFSHANPDGSISPPGKPVADAGPDRTVISPVTLSAEASYFANRYQWEIISQPLGSTASIVEPGKLRTSLTADTDGAYIIRLTARNSEGQSHSDEVTITIDSALLTAQQDITFDTDIYPILQTYCTGCHSAGLLPGIPLYYDTDSNGNTVYQNIRQRMNFAYPRFSKLLRKPIGYHHYGSTVLLDTSAEYNMIVNWLLEGGIEK